MEGTITIGDRTFLIEDIYSIDVWKGWNNKLRYLGCFFWCSPTIRVEMIRKYKEGEKYDRINASEKVEIVYFQTDKEAIRAYRQLPRIEYGKILNPMDLSIQDQWNYPIGAHNYSGRR
jgi:hypothetical protein